MTTIPYTSFETNTANWAKSQTVSAEYQKIKTDISVDSSDLLVRFSNLPLGTNVVAPPTPIPYRAELSPFYITIYDADTNLYNRLTFNYESGNELWIYEDQLLIREGDGTIFSENLLITGANLTVQQTNEGTFLSGTFAHQVDGAYDYDYYILAEITNAPDIRYVNNGRAIFEVIDYNGGDLSIANHGSDAIINTYTKVDNNTIRIPRSMDGAKPNLFANDQFNKLYVRFNRGVFG